ncbi:zona pellucida-like domain-containing protein 1 [Xenopus laevis]|nr:zona pellucida-like domain-containing protein 1 [Xenopus laevis]
MITVAILVLAIAAEQCFGQGLTCSSAYDRLPENNDINVNCGPTMITLTINVCPVQYAVIDPSTLALNSMHNLTQCNGTLDTSVDPPVIKFVFPINDTSENACGNSISIEQSAGSGLFSQYSKVETVVIGGYVDTPVSSNTGLISYSTNLNYNFSCRYPLQYLLNNTELLTSSATVAINTNNGSFISTLSMQLSMDSNFSSSYQFNGTALALKTPMYVKVAATNLTADFFVVLDECFATPNALITTIPADRYSLFTGCDVKNKTTIISNGRGKSAQFTFETFRFVVHNSLPTSTIFLHCVTRLCQPDKCAQYLASCNSSSPSSRRRRAADTSSGTSDPVTVSSGAIYTVDPDAISQSSIQALTEVKEIKGTLTGLIVGLVIAAILGAALVTGSVLLYKMHILKAQQAQKNGADNFAFSGK